MIIPPDFVMHGRRVFDVHFFQSVLGKKQLSAYGIEGKGVNTRVLLKTDNGPWLLECQLSKSSTISNSFLLVAGGKPRLFNFTLRSINVT
jgi:hypothetical protein